MQFWVGPVERNFRVGPVKKPPCIYIVDININIKMEIWFEGFALCAIIDIFQRWSRVFQFILLLSAI